MLYYRMVVFTYCSVLTVFLLLWNRSTCSSRHPTPGDQWASRRHKIYNQRGPSRVSVRQLERDLSGATSTDAVSHIVHKYSAQGTTSRGRTNTVPGLFPSVGHTSAGRHRPGEVVFKPLIVDGMWERNSVHGPTHLARGSLAPAQISLGEQYSEEEMETPDSQLAYDHFLQVRETGRCGDPQPVVLDIESSKYRHPSKYYIPAQYILHRCGVLGGCVKQTDSCVPEQAEIVDLAFLEIPMSGGYLSMGAANGGGGQTVKYLQFINHTSCACKAHSYLAACPASELYTFITGDPRVHHTSWGRSAQAADAECQCPRPYVRTHVHRGCGCDCLDSDDECLNIKYGVDTLSHHSHECVETGECNEPECSRGRYNRSCRSCPIAEPKIR